MHNKTTLIAAAILLASTAAWAQTADPAALARLPQSGPFIYMSAADIAAKVGHAGPNGAPVAAPLDRHENYNSSIVSRSADGAVERHDHWIDFTTITEGEVTLTVGGTQAGNTVDANGESHGGTQTGGQTVVLHAGDYVQIPAGMPHTMTKPKNLTYTIIKVRV